MMKTTAALCVTALALLSGVKAQAQIQLLNSESELLASDYTVMYDGLDGTLVSSMNAGQFNTIGLANTAGNVQIQAAPYFNSQGRIRVGSFNGDFIFPMPTNVLVNQTGTTSSNPGPLTISFAQAVREFGFRVDPDVGTVDFTFNVFKGSTLAFTSTITGAQQQLSYRRGITTAPFFGVRNMVAAGMNPDAITSVVISAVRNPADTTSTTSPNIFAVGPLTFGNAATVGPTAVPEPGSLALLIGVAPLSLFAARRMRRR